MTANEFIRALNPRDPMLMGAATGCNEAAPILIPAKDRSEATQDAILGHIKTAAEFYERQAERPQRPAWSMGGW